MLRIIDTSGKTIQDFDPRTSIPGEGCPSLVNHQWLGTGALLLVCHSNPSLSEAYRLDLAAGRVAERLRGYAFSASPDGTRIANVGFIVHFAPRWARSEFLEINGTQVFPKGNSVRDRDPHIVRELNGVYRDVHEFRQPFVWSPDSSRVGFTEKVFDCRAIAQALNGQCEEESIRFQLVVCETSGTCYTAPLLAGEFGLKVSWLDPVSLKVGSRMMQLSDLRSVGTR